MKRRGRVARQLTLAICSAVATAVDPGGFVALGLIRHSYDGQARATCTARRGWSPSWRRGRRHTAGPAGEPTLLTGTGVELLRVRANGKVAFGKLGARPGDEAAAPAGERVV